MIDKEQVKEQVRMAFAAVEYPGDWCLRDSDEGDEPFLVERDFRGKTDWRALDTGFIDRSPDGLASALGFFSDEAFHFYLPAYMIADLDDLLERSNPVFHLTYGLDDSSRHQRINPRRFGERTWADHTRCKFAMFKREEVAAIAAYLKFKTATDAFHRKDIEQALRNYWNERMAELGAPPNGGPATPPSNSGVAEGPPSVS